MPTTRLLGALSLLVAISVAGLAAVPTATAASRASTANDAGDQCRGTTWVFSYGDRIDDVGPVTSVRPDEHTDPTTGDTACGESRSLLCATDNPARPAADLSTVPERYRLPWSGERLVSAGMVTGSELTSRATADSICRAKLGAAWRMAATEDAGSGAGYFGSGRGLRAWVSIDDQPANPWNTHSGQALTWVVWKDFDEDLVLAATFHDKRFSNPYTGDASVDSVRPLVCIDQDGRPQPPNGLPYTPPRGGWAAGQIDLSHPVSGTRLTSRAVADRICRRDLGPDYRMAEFHDGGGWYSWGDGNVPRVWVASSTAGANPWDSAGAVGD